MYRDILTFLRAWIRSPRTVGAIIPSSPVLASAMARQIVAGEHRTVIEIGAGTGSVTQALLKQGIKPENLIVIESDPAFCKRLRLRFPEVQVLNVDAVRLEQTLRRMGISQIGTIVSSLPLLSLPRSRQLAILSQCFRLLGQHGHFIQYTYGIGSPIKPGHCQHIGIQGSRLKQVWRNIPPATIWRYQGSAAALPASSDQPASD